MAAADVLLLAEVIVHVDEAGLLPEHAVQLAPNTELPEAVAAKVTPLTKLPSVVVDGVPVTLTTADAVELIIHLE